MIESLAAFSGVYSNHRALSAVLADIAHRGETAWCLGDLGGFGPHPDRSAELLRGSGVSMLRGNYDDAIGHERDDCACGYTDARDNAFAQRSFEYTLARTAPEHRAWMRALPEQHRLVLGGRRVLLCHGSPRRVNEFLWDSASSDAFLEWLCEHHEADVIVCGHTGLRCDRGLPSAGTWSTPVRSGVRPTTESRARGTRPSGSAPK
jgi:predicted phosphodiesterase